jgi:hypothetical protein
MFSVVTVPEIKLPVDEDGTPKYQFPIAAAREKATSDFQPLEFNYHLANWDQSSSSFR